MQWRSLFLKMVDMLFFPGLWCHNYINHKEFGLPSGFLCGWSSSHLFSEDPVQAVLQTLRTRKLVSRFVSWSGWYSWYTDFRRASAWGPTEFSSEQLFNEPLGCQCGVLHTAYTAGCSPNTKCFFLMFFHVFQGSPRLFQILWRLSDACFLLSAKSPSWQRYVRPYFKGELGTQRTDTFGRLWHVALGSSRKLMLQKDPNISFWSFATCSCSAAVIKIWPRLHTV